MQPDVNGQDLMPTAATRPTLGSQMRALRARLGLTLKEMSARTGLPFSTLSKVEHDRLTLTYDKLLMISERLNIRMSELFAEPKEESGAVANSRRSIGTVTAALPVTTPNYDYFYLSPELRQKDMIPIFTRVKARSIAEFGAMVRHDGQEFLYVLQGHVTVHTEFYDPVTLSPGESVYIDSRMAHAYTAGDDTGDALVICVCSTSQEELIGHAQRQAQGDMPAVTAIDQTAAQPRAKQGAKSAGRARSSPARSRARAV
jgi:transcriptional regulator with XRE-family HTH domain